MAARVTAPFVDGRGFVRLDNGEQWTAELAPAAPALSPGDRAVVTAVRGATVEVAPAPSSPPPARRHPTLPKGAPTDGRRRSVRGSDLRDRPARRIAIFVIVVLFRSIRIIPQAYSGVVERLGRYQRTLSPD
jgi:hypothetical protein